MTNPYRMKIVMLGESGVGKTCILNRYTENDYYKTDSTLHAQYKIKNLPSPDGKYEMKQIIWDTAGQEIYRSLASFYYRDADGVILVYDISDKASFDELNYWIKEVRKNANNDVLLTIVGNKSDKINEEQVSAKTAKDFEIGRAHV